MLVSAGGKMAVNGEELWRDRIKFRIKKITFQEKISEMEWTVLGSRHSW